MADTNCPKEGCAGVRELTEMQRIPVITCPTLQEEFLCTPEYIRTINSLDINCELLAQVKEEQYPLLQVEDEAPSN